MEQSFFGYPISWVITMTVGIPRALFYHRFGLQWETFFEELDIPYLLSEASNRSHVRAGLTYTVDESCLPLKLYMGHIASLLDRADLLFVPRFVRLGRRDEFCVRFWGLYDTVQATFPDARLLSYELKSGKSGHEGRAFLKLGQTLGRGPAASLRAYHRARQRQQEADLKRSAIEQERLNSQSQGPKILLAAQPYIIHDSFLGAAVTRMIQTLGGVPITADAYEKMLCKLNCSILSQDLYWITNREILGAIQMARSQVDGIVLLTAFPCGSDCLANELVLRRVKDVPVIQIVLDGQEGQEGLNTRIESFMDMLSQRRPYRV